MEFARRTRADLSRLLMEHQFGVDEVLTKVTILREEFLHLRRYNPIEHVTSRVKSPESLVRKMVRRNVAPSVDAIREHITDIAGVRITCSFIDDTYRVLEALVSQDDVRVIQVKDYIANPKPNGYKSIHAIVEVPVFLSTGAVPVVVEIQIRTIAMDFWASLEHKIHYKFDGDVPDHLAESLSDAAMIAEQLDHRMENLHREVHGEHRADEPDVPADFDEDMIVRMWQMMRESGAN
ncbi:MAG: GTP pyrophosphokinase family protein [Demequina sp.]|uniref:GTP pyrophosphokinase n=1 Tax=Demequina sp. TaxID=2050685 RepID=UPI003A85A68D